MVSRRTRLGSLLLAGALAVTACSSGSSPSAAQNSVAPGQSAGQSAAGASGSITIADWEFSEGQFGDNVKAVLKAYEQSHAGTTINFQTMSYDSYPSTIKTQIGAGGGPDIMVLLDATFYELQKAGQLQPITSVTPDIEAKLRPANKDAVIDGKRLGVIWETVIYGLLYNKDLFQQAGITDAPKDFNTLLSDCTTIKSKTGKWGYAARNQTNELAAWYEDFTGTWIAGYGGAWTDDSGKLTINSKENVQAVTDYAKLYSSGCYDTGVKASVFRSSFKNGDVAILMDNANAGYTYTAGNNILTDQKMGSGPLPMPTKFSGMQQLYLSINKNSKNAELAQSFLQWLLQPEQQKNLVEATAPQTTATTVIPSDKFNSAHPWAMHYYTQADNGKTLLMKGRPELTTKLEAILMPYIAKVLAAQMSASDALSAAQNDAVSQLGNP